MSKSMIEAFAKAQYRALNAENNKERIGYMIAGIKDGKFYDHKTDTDYGVFDDGGVIPDTVFIPESDLELQRITGAKLATLTLNMTKFFDTYGANPKEAEDVKSDTKDTSGSSDDTDATSADTSESEPAVDYDALEKACKKAIKKGDVKKATKLLAKLDGQDCHKKLSKKLKKVSK